MEEGDESMLSDVLCREKSSDNVCKLWKFPDLGCLRVLFVATSILCLASK